MTARKLLPSVSDAASSSYNWFLRHTTKEVEKDSPLWEFPLVVAAATLNSPLLEDHHRHLRRRRLQRAFSTFPGGLPGIGLLLLRATVGGCLLLQGWFYLTERSSPTFGVRAVGLFAVGIGGLLLLGLVTPIAVILAAAISAGGTLSWFQLPAPTWLNSNLTIVFVVVIAVALIFLGPGAFSLDSRLFGRREISIPSPPRPPKS